MTAAGNNLTNLTNEFLNLFKLNSANSLFMAMEFLNGFALKNSREELNIWTSDD